MTLNEAIVHAEDVVKNNKCRNCVEDHRQLAGWLRELRFYRTILPSAGEFFRTGGVKE